MRSLYVLIVFSLFCLLPSQGWSAPFCIERSNDILDCHYYDPVRCVEKGADMNALCRINPDHPPMISGDANFCIARKNQFVECHYNDTKSCNRAAAQKKAACVPKIKE